MVAHRGARPTADQATARASPIRRGAAADWTVKKLTEWGLANVKQEPWGPTGVRARLEQRAHRRARGQAVAVAGARVRAGRGRRAPAPSCRADAVLAPIATEADFDKFRGKLRQDRAAADRAPVRRSSRRRRAALHRAEPRRDAGAAGRPPAAVRGGGFGGGPAAATQFAQKRNAFRSPKASSRCSSPPGPRRQRQRPRRRRGGSRNPKDPPVPPQLAVATEHYNRIARLLEHGQTGHARDRRAQHVPRRRPQHVQHRRGDSGHRQGGRSRDARRALRFVAHAAPAASTTPPGSAVMLEAMRILKQSGVRLRRTVRMGAVDRRRAGTDRVADVRAQPLRRSGRHEAEAGAREARRLLQHGQRHRPVSRRLPAGQRSRRADLPRVDGAVCESSA